MSPDKQKPSHDMHDIPGPHDPRWQDEDHRRVYEENMRIHTINAIDSLTSDQIPQEERDAWMDVVGSLGRLARIYKQRGHKVHIH